MNRISKKKQSIGKRVPCFWEDDDKDDIATVAEILIQLPDLILNAQPSTALTWGVKRRRSAISGALGTKSVVSATKAAATTTSPITPLMFSPSESDDKINSNNSPHVSPIYKRKNKEELMQSVADLTHQKYSLVKEMEVAKRHLDVVRASNLELKHRKQIIYGLAQPSLQIQTLPQQHPQHIHYPFQMQHSTIQWNTLPSVPAVNIIEPMCLPDLNLTLEEAANNVDGLVAVEGSGGHQASNVTMIMNHDANSRALASAQARKRRMQIYKEKIQNQVFRQR